MNIKKRIERLEREHPKHTQRFPVVFADEQDRILDDGSKELQPFVGKHTSELPDDPSGHRIIIKGPDPKEVLGIS